MNFSCNFIKLLILGAKIQMSSRREEVKRRNEEYETRNVLIAKQRNKLQKRGAFS